MWKRFLIELGTGADLHGMDVMEAATRAVKDAVSHCCMCGLVETLGIQDLKKDMRISLKIAAPDPAGVDPEALKKLLIVSSPEWPKGGLPKSCAKQAEATMVSMSDWRSFSSGCFLDSFSTVRQAMERPTLATSRLWVRRL